MAKQHLHSVRVAILAADGFEQIELTSPRKHLLQHGAQVEIVSLHAGCITGMHTLERGSKIRVDVSIEKADPSRYDALLIPGGLINPDQLRQSEAVLDFVRAFERDGKPIAAICHGPWVLISAGLAGGRRLTGWPGIKDDIRNAGADWENKAVVRNGNWITSRGPHDLLQFNAALVEHFSSEMQASDRRFSLPLGRLAAGGLALAVLGVAARWAGDGGGRSQHPARPG